MDNSPIGENVLAQVKSVADSVFAEISKVFMGDQSIPEALLTALVAKGHVLVEGVPGIAKTTLVRTFSQVVGGTFRRIQFTPDLLPSDITGSYVLDMRSNEFSLRPGPIFTHVLLGDEINRAPAKTQSALLEAMQEGQVTIEGETRKLPSPFIVLATQNPIEQEGTYPLPEAQIDRFLMKIEMGYPDQQAELQMLTTYNRPLATVGSVMQPSDVANLQKLADTVHVAPEILEYILDLARFTRRHPKVGLGASPRAGLALLRASKARAILRGRAFVLPDDVQELVGSVLSHRVFLRPDAEMEGTQAKNLLREAIASVPYRPGRVE